MDGSSESPSTPPDNAFGVSLRNARVATVLTQAELAERAGLSANAISALERGDRRHPYPSTIRALATALGLTDAEHATLASGVPRRGGHTTMDPPLTGLPVSLSPLVGRDDAVAAVVTLFRHNDVRLVTLIGPGGVGKTRLALQIAAEVAHAYTHGVAFVSLATVHDPALVVLAVAQALGIVERGGRSAVDLLKDALAARHLLLVLDNYEQVLESAPLVTNLLSQCPRLAILVTSRVVLRLDGEQVVPVSPLAVSDPERLPTLEQLAHVGAIRLFVNRAQRANPTFVLTDGNAGAVAEICHRLDGLPLPIELAAARGALLGPEMMLSQLTHRLPLLTGGRRDAPTRHRTMRDAIAWSYDLLTDEEQAIFRRSAVFVGGFSMETVQLVAVSGEEGHDRFISLSSIDGITALVEASLLWPESGPDGEQRFFMLETIREYGLERLAEAGEMDQVRSMHAACFVAGNERFDPNAIEPGERVEDRLWRIDAEHPNLQAALAHLADSGDAEGVLQLAGALAVFWHHRGYLIEGRRWLEWALAQTEEIPSISRGRALAGLSLIIWSQGEYERAAPLAEAALAIAETIDAGELAALAIHLLGLVELMLGRMDRAKGRLEEALKRQQSLGLWSDAAMALMVLSKIAYATGDITTAAHRAEDALGRFRALGHPAGASSALDVLATIALDRGDDPDAAAAYHHVLRLWSTVEDRYATRRSTMSTGQGSLFPRWTSVDDRRSIILALSGLANLASRHGQAKQAALLVGAVDVRMEEFGTHLFEAGKHGLAQIRAATLTLCSEEQVASLRTDGRALPLSKVIGVALTITVSEATPETNALHIPRKIKVL